MNVITRVQINQDGLKLDGTHQVLIYSDDANILGGSVLAIKKNAEALLVASKAIRIKLNADKSKCMVMSRDKNAGQNKNIKTDK